eukprot:CAMPEP_0194266954 /NCGR_PEP_ID=MMETSP0169-20130528/1668_1 /TAXON_ID=218684 /ORGANISM="Corethron pennatum, Strain L29A3" /LENGTH=165 /DNA_ID=CAMNT_0039007735 /DNA_START=162 /DNA_END=659 /DNA_ORIENTATION=-
MSPAFPAPSSSAPPLRPDSAATSDGAAATDGAPAMSSFSASPDFPATFPGVVPGARAASRDIRPRRPSLPGQMDVTMEEDLLPPDDMMKFVTGTLDQMQSRFSALSDSIIGRIDDMGDKIDDLEQNISDLMEQAGSIQTDTTEVNGANLPEGAGRGGAPGRGSEK